MISLVGYPLIITAHSIGLAFMVGPVFILNLRLLGFFRGIPYTFFNRILALAWTGFVVNFLSGVVLFTMEATSYISDVPFLTKISFVFLGAISAAYQQAIIHRGATSWQTNGVPFSVKVLAFCSLIFWIGAIIAGRLIAYLD
jgi:hypothetical protein